MRNQQKAPGSQLEKRILKLNKEAMQYLGQEDFARAYKLLSAAQSLLTQHGIQKPGLMSITYNNLGCFYQRTGKPKQGLQNLLKAIKLEYAAQTDLTTIAGTHLNICTIYSSLKNHDKALHHAERALLLLKDNYNTTNSCLTSLVIAYHNVGTEYEYLKDYNRSVEFYKNGYDLAFCELGQEHSLTLSLKRCFDEGLTRIGRSRGGPRVQIKPQSKRTIRKPLKSTDVSLRALSGGYQEDMGDWVKRMRKEHSGKKRFDLQNLRFLTGGRLQPMFPDENFQNRSIQHISLTREGPREPVTMSARYSGKLRPLEQIKARLKRPKRFEMRKTEKLSFGLLIFKEFLANRIQEMAKRKVRRVLSTGRKRELRPVELRSKSPGRLIPKPLPAPKDPLSSIIKIQSTIRTFLAKTRYNSIINASITIQKNIRRYQCYKLFKSIKSAIIFIQRWYRNATKGH